PPWRSPSWWPASWHWSWWSELPSPSSLPWLRCAPPAPAWPRIPQIRNRRAAAAAHSRGSQGYGTYRTTTTVPRYPSGSRTVFYPELSGFAGIAISRSADPYRSSGRTRLVGRPAGGTRSGASTFPPGAPTADPGVDQTRLPGRRRINRPRGRSTGVCAQRAEPVGDLGGVGVDREQLVAAGRAGPQRHRGAADPERLRQGAPSGLGRPAPDRGCGHRDHQRRTMRTVVVATDPGT